MKRAAGFTIPFRKGDDKMSYSKFLSEVLITEEQLKERIQQLGKKSQEIIRIPPIWY